MSLISRQQSNDIISPHPPSFPLSFILSYLVSTRQSKVQPQLSSTTHPVFPPPLASTSIGLSSSWRSDQSLHSRWSCTLSHPAQMRLLQFPLIFVTGHSSTRDALKALQSSRHYLLTSTESSNPTSPQQSDQSPLLTLLFALLACGLKGIRSSKWPGTSLMFNGTFVVALGRNIPISENKIPRQKDLRSEKQEAKNVLVG